MRKRYKMGLVIISVLILLFLSLGIFKFFIKEEEKEKNTTYVVSNIEEYGYSLDDRDTKYMKETFEELKKVLDEDEIKEEEYAKNLAKLYIIDFYTLNNKINKYDVGSLEYILSSKKDSFKSKAMDTIYKDIIDNTYKDRIQDLPEITKVEILSTEKNTYKIEEKEYESYKITMKYEYKKDLGYDTEGTIEIVKNGKKLEVAFYNPKIEETEN